MFDTRLLDSELFMSGRLDASQVDQARQALIANPACTVVNLRELEFICSGGIGLFFGHYQRLHVHGYRLTIREPRPHIRRILELAKLDSFADII